jgi:cytochrome c-type biogenesis protein
MPDPIAMSATAIAKQTVAAPFLVFLAGIVSSFGPCVAPRFIALSACSAQAERPRLVLVAFVGGLVVAYASFGTAASLLGGMRAYSSPVYAMVALALAVGGIVTLLHAEHCDDRTGPPAQPAQRSFGGVFLLGASFAFVLSPCCTPLVAMILAYTSLAGRGLYGCTLLSLFALGHALPLIVYGAVSARIATGLRRIASSQAVTITSGALMLGLAGYYALLV